MLAARHLQVAAMRVEERRGGHANGEARVRCSCGLVVLRAVNAILGCAEGAALRSTCSVGWRAVPGTHMGSGASSAVRTEEEWAEIVFRSAAAKDATFIRLTALRFSRFGPHAQSVHTV